jgi:Spo0E like sporulation regulatory protein.
MINEQIEILREKLNAMVVSEPEQGEELLKLSQELDTLIMEFMREKYKEVGNAL